MGEIVRLDRGQSLASRLMAVWLQGSGVCEAWQIVQPWGVAWGAAAAAAGGSGALAHWLRPATVT